MYEMANVGRGRPATEVDDGNHFGAWLRQERLKREMTGESLAFAYGEGMSQGRVSAYERGIKKPERATAAALAEALGADPREALSALMMDTPGVQAFDPRIEALADMIKNLQDRDREMIEELVARLVQERV